MLNLVLVSVVMTVFNREDFVSEAIESVLNQSIEDLELIIIDDASLDNSKEIIKIYKEKDKRIKIILHKKNMGIAKSTNDGVDIAKGKYVAIIDSDDLWIKNKLEEQLKILKKGENLIIWTNGEIIDSDGKSLGIDFIELHQTQNRKKSGKIFRELLKGNFINKSSLIFKKTNLRDIRFNQNFKRLDDYQFVVDLSEKYEFFFFKKNLTKIRQHNRNITNSDYIILYLDYIKINKYFLIKYGNEIPVKIKLYLYNLIIILSIKLSMNIERLQMYEFRVDPYKFIFNLSHESKYIRNELLKDQNKRVTWILYRLYCKSFRSFIVGLAFVFKFKKIQKSIRFWVNFIIFLCIKLIPNLKFPQYFLRK